MAYNGWKDWETWNVALWINNDENLYNMAQENVRLFSYPVAAGQMLEELHENGVFQTPDKATYTRARILDAIRDMAIGDW